MLTLWTSLPNSSIPDVPSPVLLSTIIRSRFQAKPATLLIPINFSFSRWRSFTVLGTKVAFSPELMWGLALTACVVFSFFLQHICPQETYSLVPYHPWPCFRKQGTSLLTKWRQRLPFQFREQACNNYKHLHFWLITGGSGNTNFEGFATACKQIVGGRKKRNCLNSFDLWLQPSCLSLRLLLLPPSTASSAAAAMLVTLYTTTTPTRRLSSGLSQTAWPGELLATMTRSQELLHHLFPSQRPSAH